MTSEQRPRTAAGVPGPLPAKLLAQGSWTSRWGDWVIHLRGTDGGWRATVWRWTTGGRLQERTQLGLGEGFSSALEATAWACDVLRESGAKVFIIDKPQLKLEDIACFHAAPEAVT